MEQLRELIREILKEQKDLKMGTLIRVWWSDQNPTEIFAKKPNASSYKSCHAVLLGTDGRYMDIIFKGKRREFYVNDPDEFQTLSDG